MTLQAEESLKPQVEEFPVSDSEIKETIVEPSRRWYAINALEIWQYRELLLFLVWRDLKVRYKQTMLGAAWILLQPLLTTVVFTLLFGGLLQVPSGDVPYPVFVLTALVPWNYFASSLNKSSTSLVISSNLITKIYFPRLLIPMAVGISGLVDFSIGFIVLICLMFYYAIGLSASIVILLPVLLLLTMIATLGFSAWLSALNVRYRDIGYLVPFLIQVWMYLTPVIYPSSLIPERFRFLMALNPMTCVIEGFRWALLGPELGSALPPIPVMIVSILVTLTVFISGLLYFRHTERTFADII